MDDNRCGFGKMEYSDGEFCLLFVKCCGVLSVLIIESSGSVQGAWKNDNVEGEAVEVFSDGTRYCFVP